jgi:hypothetical protein
MLHTGRQKNEIAKELTALQNSPNVLGVSSEEASIKVLIDEVYVDGVVPIGPYIITLDIRKAAINIHNINNPKNGFDHPHVNYGNPCWGNYSDILVHLSNGELTTTLDLVQVFLATWNPEDEWGKNLVNWDAKYTFETFEEMDMLERLHDYSREYEEIFDRNFPYRNVCPRCGEPEDAYGDFSCDCTCSDCGEWSDECTCHNCPGCGEHEDDCVCHMCPYCGRHEDDCECVFCPECGENLRYISSGYCTECYTCHDCGCDCEEETVEPEETILATSPYVIPLRENTYTTDTVRTTDF